MNTLKIGYLRNEYDIFETNYDLLNVDYWSVKWGKLYITPTEDAEELIVLPIFSSPCADQDGQGRKYPERGWLNGKKIEV